MSNPTKREGEGGNDSGDDGIFAEGPRDDGWTDLIDTAAIQPPADDADGAHGPEPDEDSSRGASGGDASGIDSPADAGESETDPGNEGAQRSTTDSSDGTELVPTPEAIADATLEVTRTDPSTDPAAADDLVRRDHDDSGTDTSTSDATQDSDGDAPPNVDDLDGDAPPNVDDFDDDETEVALVEWIDDRATPTREDVRAAVLSEVRAYFDAVDLDTHFADRPTDEFIDAQWFDFSYLDEVVQIERHWVNRPYAYISIVFDTTENEFRYHVTEVTLDDFEEYVREDLTRILRNSLMYLDIDTDAGRESVFESHAKDEIAEHAAIVRNGSIYKLLYYLLRDFVDYGKMDPLMRDPDLEDISCDGVEVPIFVYHNGYRDLRSNVSFDGDSLASFVVQLAQRAGKHISVSDPLVDASLPDGSRIQLTLGGDIATRGSNFTIRKFANVPYTPVDLIRWNTFDAYQMAYFWLAIENNKSLVFAGGTGSGKTTSMNALGFFIPPNSKVVSIEDTREMTLPHDNWIQSVTRRGVTAGGRGEVTMYQLLQASLRQRPEYLLVGEVRTEQNVGLTFFNAIATGHTSYTTIHADSVQGVLGRLENPPLSIPVQLIQDLDVIAIQKQIFTDDNRVRRNHAVAELLPAEDFSAVDYQNVFEWDPRTDAYTQPNESHLLAEIATERGWSSEDLQTELDARRDVLTALVDDDVRDYDDVTTVIHGFHKDREAVLDALAEDDIARYLDTERRSTAATGSDASTVSEASTDSAASTVSDAGTESKRSVR